MANNGKKDAHSNALAFTLAPAVTLCYRSPVNYEKAEATLGNKCSQPLTEHLATTRRHDHSSVTKGTRQMRQSHPHEVKKKTATCSSLKGQGQPSRSNNVIKEITMQATAGRF